MDGSGVRDGVALLIRSINLARKNGAGVSLTKKKGNLFSSLFNKGGLEARISAPMQKVSDPDPARKSRRFTLRGKKDKMMEEIMEKEMELQKYLQTLEEGGKGGKEGKEGKEGRGGEGVKEVRGVSVPEIDLDQLFSQESTVDVSSLEFMEETLTGDSITPRVEKKRLSAIITPKLHPGGEEESEEELTRLSLEEFKAEELKREEMKREEMSGVVLKKNKKMSCKEQKRKSKYISTKLGSKLFELEKSIDLSSSSSSLRCVECHSLLDDMDIFCAECGAPVKKVERAKEDGESGERVKDEVDELVKVLEEIQEEKEEKKNSLEKRDSVKLVLVRKKNAEENERQLWRDLSFLEELFVAEEEEKSACNNALKTEKSQEKLKVLALECASFVVTYMQDTRKEWSELEEEKKEKLVEELKLVFSQDFEGIVPLGLSTSKLEQKQSLLKQRAFTVRTVQIGSFGEQEMEVQEGGCGGSIVSQFLQEYKKQLSAFTLQIMFMANASALSEKSGVEEVVKLCSTLVQVHKNLLDTCQHIEGVSETTLTIVRSSLFLLEQLSLSEEPNESVLRDASLSSMRNYVRKTVVEEVRETCNCLRIATIYSLRALSLLQHSQNSEFVSIDSAYSLHSSHSPSEAWCSVEERSVEFGMVQLSSVAKCLPQLLQRLLSLVCTSKSILSQSEDSLDAHLASPPPLTVDFWSAYFERKKKAKIPGERRHSVFFKKKPSFSDLTSQKSGLHATLNELVEMVTSVKDYNVKNMRAFMSTFPSLLSPSLLLHKLKERFHPPPLLSKEEATAVRVRVLVLVKHWITYHFDSLSSQDVLLLRSFLKEAMESQTDVASLLLLKLEEFSSEREAFKLPLKQPSSDLSLSTASLLPNLLFLHTSSKELASQLTLLDFGIFKKIRHSELFGANWEKPSSSHLSPNVRKLTARMNHLSYFLASLILSFPHVSKRREFVLKLMHVAVYLRQLNNFHTLMCIYTTFHMTCISRLKETWNEIHLSTSKADKTIFQEYKKLEELMSPLNGFSSYKAALKTARLPILPFLGVSLSEIVRFEEGIPDYVNDGDESLPLDLRVINFDKKLQVYNSVCELLKYQAQNYEFLPMDPAYTLLSELPFALDDDDLLSLSYLRESNSLSSIQLDNLKKRQSIIEANEELRRRSSVVTDSSELEESIISENSIPRNPKNESMEEIPNEDLNKDIQEILEIVEEANINGNEELQEIKDVDEFLEQYEVGEEIVDS